jgi:hypothetical protein
MTPTTTRATTKTMSFFSSLSMSAPGPRGCGAENADYTERGKDRGENRVIYSPGDGCAGQRQDGKQNKVARLGVHFRSRLKGAATRLPLLLCAS